MDVHKMPGPLKTSSGPSISLRLLDRQHVDHVDHAKDDLREYMRRNYQKGKFLRGDAQIKQQRNKQKERQGIQEHNIEEREKFKKAKARREARANYKRCVSRGEDPVAVFRENTQKENKREPGPQDAQKEKR
jgi:hypothetical protein